jgi:hypothetical protein
MGSFIMVLSGIIIILVAIAIFYFGGFYDCLFNGNCPPPTNISNDMIAGGI